MSDNAYSSFLTVRFAKYCGNDDLYRKNMKHQTLFKNI